MIAPHSRTVAVARLLRAISPAQHRRRGGRMPRQLQPDAIRLAYYQALLPIVREQTAPLRYARAEILRLLGEERAMRPATDRVDAGERERRAAEVVEKAGRASARLFRPREVHQVAERFARRTSEFNRQQLDRQTRAAIGVAFSAIERPIKDLVPVFVGANVELIKSIPTRFQDRVARDVREAFASGMSVDTLARKLVDGEDASESDARRIARDQVGRLNAQFNEERQTAMGVVGYTWRTARDSRVRDGHERLEGAQCTWDEEPEGGGTDEDELGHPGSGIQCRCYAEPDFSPILDEL